MRFQEVRHSQTVWFTITVPTSYLKNSCVMLWAKAFSSERVKLFFRYWITYTSHLLFMSLPIQCPPPTCKIIWSPDTGDRLPFFSLQLVHIKLYKLYNLIFRSNIGGICMHAGTVTCLKASSCFLHSSKTTLSYLCQ